MREMVSIQAGQCGNQIGSKFGSLMSPGEESPPPTETVLDLDAREPRRADEYVGCPAASHGQGDPSSAASGAVGSLACPSLQLSTGEAIVRSLTESRAGSSMTRPFCQTGEQDQTCSGQLGIVVDGGADPTPETERVVCDLTRLEYNFTSRPCGGPKGGGGPKATTSRATSAMRKAGGATGVSATTGGRKPDPVLFAGEFAALPRECDVCDTNVPHCTSLCPRRLRQTLQLRGGAQPILGVSKALDNTFTVMASKSVVSTYSAPPAPVAFGPGGKVVPFVDHRVISPSDALMVETLRLKGSDVSDLDSVPGAILKQHSRASLDFRVMNSTYLLELHFAAIEYQVVLACTLVLTEHGQILEGWIRGLEDYYEEYNSQFQPPPLPATAGGGKKQKKDTKAPKQPWQQQDPVPCFDLYCHEVFCNTEVMLAHHKLAAEKGKRSHSTGVFYDAARYRRAREILPIFPNPSRKACTLSTTVHMLAHCFGKQTIKLTSDGGSDKAITTDFLGRPATQARRTVENWSMPVAHYSGEYFLAGPWRDGEPTPPPKGSAPYKIVARPLREVVSRVMTNAQIHTALATCRKQAHKIRPFLTVIRTGQPLSGILNTIWNNCPVVGCTTQCKVALVAPPLGAMNNAIVPVPLVINLLSSDGSPGGLKVGELDEVFVRGPRSRAGLTVMGFAVEVHAQGLAEEVGHSFYVARASGKNWTVYDDAQPKPFEVTTAKVARLLSSASFVVLQTTSRNVDVTALEIPVHATVPVSDIGMIHLLPPVDEVQESDYLGLFACAGQRPEGPRVKNRPASHVMEEVRDRCRLLWSTLAREHGLSRAQLQWVDKKVKSAVTTYKDLGDFPTITAGFVKYARERKAQVSREYVEDKLPQAVRAKLRRSRKKLEITVAMWNSRSVMARVRKTGAHPDSESEEAEVELSEEAAEAVAGGLDPDAVAGHEKDGLPKLASFLEMLVASGADLAVLTEIWDPGPGFEGICSDFGFDVVTQSRRTGAQRVRGGVAILLRRDHSCLKRGVISLSYGEACRATVAIGGTHLKVVAAYLPDDMGEGKVISEQHLELVMDGADLVLGDFNGRHRTWCPRYASSRSIALRRGDLVDSAASDNRLSIVNRQFLEPTTIEGTCLDLIMHGAQCTSTPIVATAMSGLSDHHFVQTTLRFGAVSARRPAKRSMISWAAVKPHHLDAFKADVERRLRRLRIKPTATDNTHKFFVACLKKAAGAHLPWTRGGSLNPPAPAVVEAGIAASRAQAAALDDPRLQAVADTKAEQYKKVATAALRLKLARKPHWAMYKLFKLRESAQEVALESSPGVKMSDAQSSEVINTLYTEKSPPPAGYPKEVDPQHPWDPGGAVDIDEIRRSIFAHNVHTARDPDGISVRLLQALPDAAFQFLAYMSTDALKNGRIPQAWRECVYTPLYKGKGKSALEGSSYRPVAMTSLLSRTWERVVLLRAERQFCEYLCTSQYGYRRGRGACQALLRMIRFARHHLGKTDKSGDSTTGGDSRSAKVRRVGVLSLDATDAFCAVQHSRILTALNETGLDQYLVRAIMAWLRERRHRTKVGSTLSEWQPVTNGVPQGSCLGPVCYILGVNDMNEETETVGAGLVSSKKVKGALSGSYADDSHQMVASISLPDSTAALETWGAVNVDFLVNNNIKVSAKSALNFLVPSNSARVRRPEYDMRLDGGVVNPLSVTYPGALEGRPLTLQASDEPVRVLGADIGGTLPLPSLIERAKKTLEDCYAILDRVRYHMHPRQLRELYLSFGIGGIRHLAPVLTDWPVGDPDYSAAAQLAFMELELIHVRCARLIMKTSSTAAIGCCLRAAGLYPLALVLHGDVVNAEEQMLRWGDSQHLLNNPSLAFDPRSKEAVPLANSMFSPTPASRTPVLQYLPYKSLPAACAAARSVRFHVDIGLDATGKPLRKENADDDPEPFRLDSLRRVKKAAAEWGSPRLELWTDGAVAGVDLHVKRAAHAYEIWDNHDLSTSPVESNGVSSGPYASTYFSESLGGLDGLTALLLRLDTTGIRGIHILWGTDSRSLLEALNKGVLDQTDFLCAETWLLFIRLVEEYACKISCIFIYSHVGVIRNESVDKVAGTKMANLDVVPSPPHRRGIWWNDAAREKRKVFRVQLCHDSADPRHRPGRPRPGGLALRCYPHSAAELRHEVAPDFLGSGTWPHGTMNGRDCILLAQLQTGVCGKLGGFKHSVADTCLKCNTPSALARRGKAADHLFSCEASADLRAEIFGPDTECTPSLLWTHPAKAVRYARSHLSLPDYTAGD